MKTKNNKSRKSLVVVLSVAIVFVALAFLVLKPVTMYEEKYDVTGDGIVDMYDFKSCLLDGRESCDFNGDDNIFDEIDMELMWDAIKRHESNVFSLLPLTISNYVCSDADLNDDGVVNALDLAIFGQHYGECGDYVGDINGDGCVNYDDQIILAAYFGLDCDSTSTTTPLSTTSTIYSTTSSTTITTSTTVYGTTTSTVYIPFPCDIDEIYINGVCTCKSDLFRFAGQCYPIIYIYISIALVGVVGIFVYRRQTK